MIFCFLILICCCLADFVMSFCPPFVVEILDDFVVELCSMLMKDLRNRIDRLDAALFRYAP